LYDFRALQKRLKGLLVVRQVDVTHPLSQLGILQTGVLLGRWLKGLCHKVKLGSKYCKLAGIRSTESTDDPYEVSEIQQLCQFEIGIADMSFRNHDLDVAGQIADVKKHEFASGAHQDDSARDAYLRTDLFACPLLSFPSFVVDRLPAVLSAVEIRKGNQGAIRLAKLNLSNLPTDLLDKQAIVESLAPRVQAKGLDFFKLL
jgi:hypothetical protein